MEEVCDDDKEGEMVVGLGEGREKGGGEGADIVEFEEEKE